METQYKDFSESTDVDKLRRMVEESMRSGFDSAVGIEYRNISPDRVTAKLQVHEGLFQPAGIVHGGVLTSLVEAAGSAGGGAWLFSKDWDAVFVGVGNNTDFIRPVTGGVLDIVASPIQRGSRIQLWEVEVRDQDDKLVCTGRLKGQNVFTDKEGAR